jgi:hypothetical protein
LYVLCTIESCSENFWSGLEKFNIAHDIDCLILSWVFLNFWSGLGFFDIRCIVDCLILFYHSSSDESV